MSKKSKRTVSFPTVNPNACGIDIGSTSNWTCVGEDRCDTREFGVFTDDHHELAKWLLSKKVKTVAMESTGIYWKPLFLILQSYGFEVILVNAGHVKNVRGKKTDISDCKWIWKLHQAGLLHGSFQPDVFTEEIRTYNRRRQSLIEGSSQCILRMQKSMILMNLQLSVVLTDITGKSGKLIIQAILCGERDATKLAALADPRVKADKVTIIRALTGQWHEQQLFVLQQAWQMYNMHQQQIRACDAKIEQLLQDRVWHNNQNDLVYDPPKRKPLSKNSPDIEMDKLAFQLSDGVDLMAIEGVGPHLIMTLIAEVGLNPEKHFPNSKHFTSWLGLSPNKRITGGKILSSKTIKNKNRLAHAFRKAANAAGRKKGTALSAFFARILRKKGRKAAITATARKIAVIVYQMLSKKEPYSPQHLEEYTQKVKEQKVKYINKMIQAFSIQANDLELDLA